MAEDVLDKQRNLRHELEDVAFGSIAGMVGKVVEYPFDTIKVRLQTQPADHATFRGPLDCFATTVRRQGVIGGLYKGMTIPLIGAMLENATLFVGYRQLQRVIRLHTGQLDESVPLPMSQLLLASAGAGALASVVLTPVELIKCKLQIQLDTHHERYRGPWHVITHLWGQQHGLRAYYRGFVPTLVRESGATVCWFGPYEYTCHLCLQRKGKGASKKDLSPAELMLGGAMGGIGYNLSMFPVDSIKSQMQTDDELRPGSAPRSFKDVAREIYHQAGIRGFYRGCGITVARSAPTSAIIFMTYELLTQHFGS
ncbi:mitochondrial carrier domain-containing protein [Gongronella butleri]|nr:mitochondrial carrier domain-containing protein [Gongronella butleri]